MDSVTQAVLGGAVSYAILGQRIGKRAALYGAAFGTLPDLDVLIDFGGPIENMTYHRGFSHSFLIQAPWSCIGTVFFGLRITNECSRFTNHRTEHSKSVLPREHVVRYGRYDGWKFWQCPRVFKGR